MCELKKYTATWVVDNGLGSMSGNKRSATVMAVSKEHALSKIQGNVLDQISILMTFDDEIESGIFDHTFLIWT